MAMAMGMGLSLLLSVAFVVVFVFETSHASHIHAVEEYKHHSDLPPKSGSIPLSHPYRTAFHFQPLKNWMNDPNAPMLYKGYYHLFYQYNPKEAVWGLIVWGHAVSKDLVNWMHFSKPALEPDEWYDTNGCWSGSATFIHNDRGRSRGGGIGIPMILYTGQSNASEQVQILAVPKNPSDPFLREWRKVPQNPVILPLALNASSFRDPTTAWVGRDHRWRILVGNKKDKRRLGMALLYRSTDFIRWEKAKHPLHSALHTGMWECPDFYPVHLSSNQGLDTSAAGPSVKHVLKNSLDDYKVDYYTLGTYLADVDRFVPDNASIEGPDGLRYDYGKFYASKTFYDHDKARRILWGWVNESDTATDDMAKGWASLQAIPRVVSLDTMTQSSLIQWPVPELEALRGQHVTKHNLVLQNGSLIKIEGLKSGAQVDVEVTFNFPHNHHHQEEFEEIEDMSIRTAQSLCNSSTNKGFGLMVLASDDLKERSLVFFRFFQDKLNRKLRRVALCVDQSRSTLRADVDKTSYGGFVGTSSTRKSLSLRVLVDHSIVESFAEGGRTCITSRSYPTMAVNENAHLFAFNYGNSSVAIHHLTAWHMNNAHHVYAVS